MWGLNLFISWSTQNQEHSRHFFTAEAYAIKDEAETICIDYGKLIIDGEIPGSSVGSADVRELGDGIRGEQLHKHNQERIEAFRRHGTQPVLRLYETPRAIFDLRF